MSTSIDNTTTAQAQTSSTNHPNPTMATLVQESLDLPTSALALGRQRQVDSLIEIVDNVVDITGPTQLPTQLSAAPVYSDNANDVDNDVPLDRDNVDNVSVISSGWMSDIAERQTAFHIPAVQPQGACVAVDDEIEFHFRSDRSPIAPRAFIYDTCSRQSSRQSSRAPSRRSGVSERADPVFDLVNKLVDKISVDAARKESDLKAEMERQKADMRREMSLEIENARLRSLVDAQRDLSISDKRTVEHGPYVSADGGGAAVCATGQRASGLSDVIATSGGAVVSVRPASGPSTALRDSGSAAAAVYATDTRASDTTAAPAASECLFDVTAAATVLVGGPVPSLGTLAHAGNLINPSRGGPTADADTIDNDASLNVQLPMDVVNNTVINAAAANDDTCLYMSADTHECMSVPVVSANERARVMTDVSYNNPAWMVNKNMYTTVVFERPMQMIGRSSGNLPWMDDGYMPNTITTRQSSFTGDRPISSMNVADTQYDSSVYTSSSLVIDRPLMYSSVTGGPAFRDNARAGKQVSYMAADVE